MNVRSAMPSILAAFIFVLAANMPAKAVILVDPCAVSSQTTFSPLHPGPTDEILLRSTVWSGYLLPPGVVVMAQGMQLVDGSVTLDVVVTDRVAAFPSYKVVNDLFQDVYADLGPLAPGTHQVQTSLRNFSSQSGQSTNLCPTKASTISVGATSGPTVKLPVVEFYNLVLDHYFATQDPNEIRDLDNGSFVGWSRTGQSFLAYVPGQSDGRADPVCRFYGLPSAGIDSHFYSASLSECDILKGGSFNNAWLLESDNVFEMALPDTLTGACPLGLIPAYRLWNNRFDSNHRYTTDAAIRDAMVAKGYILEGYGKNPVAMCAVGS